LGGQDVLVVAGWDGAVSAGGAGEALDGAAGAGLDEPGDGERSERDGQAGVDGLALVMVFGLGGPGR
jgi:hypothetical protein